MNAASGVVGIALIAVAGRWSQGKPLDIKVAIGFGVLAMFVAAFNESYPALVSKFVIVILITAIFMYGPDIFKKAGLVK